MKDPQKHNSFKLVYVTSQLFMTPITVSVTSYSRGVLELTICAHQSATLTLSDLPHCPDIANHPLFPCVVHTF